MRRDGWRSTDLLAEAWANAFAPGSRLLMTLAVAVLVGVCFTGVRAAELTLLRHEIATQEAAGRNLLTIQGTSPENTPRIERNSCEQLATRDEVLAAGAMDGGTHDWFAQLGTAVPVYAASTTLLPQLAYADAVIGSALTDAPAGTRINLAYRDSTLTAVIGTVQPTGLSFNNAVVVGIDPTLTFTSSCIVLLDQRQTHTEDAPALLAELNVHDHPVLAATLVGDSGSAYARFRDRWARFLPLGIGALLGGFVLLTARLRSSELAAYRLSGTSSASLATLLTFEAGVVATVYWLSGSAATLLLLPTDGIVHALALLGDHAMAAATATLSAALLCLPIARTSPMKLAKDR